MRTVIEGPGFANVKYQIHSDPEILDEILEAIYFTLARKPEIGLRAAGPVHAISLERWQPRGTRPFTLFYLFSSTQVTLVGLLLTEQS